MFTVCFIRPRVESRFSQPTANASQIVITEKTSQAKDVRAAVSSRYGDILPAEGHLFDLLEPEHGYNAQPLSLAALHGQSWPA
jgi:hypothetical protein